ncbi:hypothetical protein HHK36_012310 [Tetracentron sinense]|uniref:DUF7731 domain-containing protein n=1 Tax=Tetracentron sinense TaxID=13715 RepID=A0A835DEG8_TETSI|nr:hypothetical protein HHK36_012310 [Tetracentron sinense]
MAFSVTPVCRFFLVGLISIAVFCCNSGCAQGISEDDPAQIVAKALLCFNDKFIYSSCDEAYRLTESGNINIPHEETDQFCDGPCLTETHLVLNCIENILSNFLFYNKATIHDIKDTLHAGCSYSSERGNFNVAEHIQGESSNAHRVVIPIYFYVYMLMILCCRFLLP